MTAHEVDVAVLGYGAAGGAAAIEAHDAGAEALILEKCPEPGGNTRVSSAMMVFPERESDWAGLAAYLNDVCGGLTPADLIQAFVDGLREIPAWLAALGGELEGYDYASSDPSCSYYIPNVTFPDLPSAQGLRLVVRRLARSERRPEPTGGNRVWSLLDDNVRSRGIRVIESARAKRLETGPTGAVTGVRARTPDGEILVRARGGVVLSCGGFEYDEGLKREHLRPNPVGALGHPGNTGDGIRMAQRVGADLWHMRSEASALGFRPPGWRAGFGITLRRPGFIYVDRRGARYTDESRLEAHVGCQATEALDEASFEYPRIPTYLVMDEENARTGPIAMTVFSHNVVVEGYRWSEDNSREIERGWIVRAESSHELERLLGMPGGALATTLARYAEACRQGVDADHGRLPQTLKSLEPPYYAMRLEPLLYNTQGGPRRDQRSRVLDPDGEPIRGLYGAGELGAPWGFRYQTSLNVTEALISGRSAGRHAAARAGRRRFRRSEEGVPEPTPSRGTKPL